MNFIQIGNIVINLDQVTSMENKDSEVTVYFAAGASRSDHSLRFKEAEAEALRTLMSTAPDVSRRSLAK